MLCRAAKSSIVSIATGEPVGEPETLRCPMMSENAATGIGSSTAPTTCSRPLGASVPIIASQSSGTLTVLIRRSKLPASFLIAAESLLDTTWFAPKPLGFVELALARRERGHVAAVRGGELHGHVPEPADADDADAVGRLGVHRQRREDGDAAAQERAGVGEVQLVRQRDGPRPVRADVAGEPAAMTDDGELHLRAQVMASRHALAAVHAAPRVPADADALADLESLGVRTDGRDPTDDLVAENRGVLRDAPLVVQDGEVGVTQAAVLDGDFDVLGPERAEIDGFERHRLFRRLGDPGLVTFFGPADCFCFIRWLTCRGFGLSVDMAIPFCRQSAFAGIDQLARWVSARRRRRTARA